MGLLYINLHLQRLIHLLFNFSQFVDKLQIRIFGYVLYFTLHNNLVYISQIQTQKGKRSQRIFCTSIVILIMYNRFVGKKLIRSAIILQDLILDILLLVEMLQTYSALWESLQRSQDFNLFRRSYV